MGFKLNVTHLPSSDTAVGLKLPIFISVHTSLTLAFSVEVHLVCLCACTCSWSWLVCYILYSLLLSLLLPEDKKDESGKTGWIMGTFEHMEIA